MKPILKLMILGILCGASVLSADEAKEATKKEIQEIEKKIEELNKRLQEHEAVLDELRKAHAEAKKSEKAAPKFFEPPLPKRGAPSKQDNTLSGPLGQLGYVVTEPKSDVFNDALETGGTTFITHKQAAYHAERHSAEKIKARVRAADEKAKLLLEGKAPSLVTPAEIGPRQN